MTLEALSDWVRGRLGYRVVVAPSGVEDENIEVFVRDDRDKVIASASGWTITQAIKRLELPR